MTETESLARAFVALGAASERADVLAAQLLKRAEQLARERGQSREQALQYLWNLLVQARSGGPPPILPEKLDDAFGK